jgi:hypothetical protein
MATIEEQLLPERQRTWKRFAVSGFVIAILTMIFLGIMLLAAVN